MKGLLGRRGGIRWRGWVLPLLPLLLTGCGPDRPYSGPPPALPRPAQAAPPDDSNVPSAPAAAGPTDPLIGNAGQPPADPLLRGDPLQGRAMPTAHSHWLRGYLRDARVTVLLNGVRYKSYSGVIEGDDITMRLRRGVNTVSFVYQPHSAASAADLEIVESEHDPPIAPLVTFRKPPDAAAAEDTSKPLPEPYTFVAN